MKKSQFLVLNWHKQKIYYYELHTSALTVSCLDTWPPHFSTIHSGKHSQDKRIFYGSLMKWFSSNMQIAVWQKVLCEFMSLQLSHDDSVRVHKRDAFVKVDFQWHQEKSKLSEWETAQTKRGSICGQRSHPNSTEINWLALPTACVVRHSTVTAKCQDTLANFVKILLI